MEETAVRIGNIHASFMEQSILMPFLRICDSCLKSTLPLAREISKERQVNTVVGIIMTRVGAFMVKKLMIGQNCYC